MHIVDDSLEFRKKRSDILTKVSERPLFGDSLQSPESRIEFFDQLGAEGFVSLVKNVNRMLTKQSSDEVVLSQDYNVILDPDDPHETFMLMPAPEDKELLLMNLYTIASEIPYDSKDAAEHIATVVGFGINAVHPFLYANGRTARTMYALLAVNGEYRADLLDKAAGGDDADYTYLNPVTFRNPLFEKMKRYANTHSEIDGVLMPHVQPAITSRVPLYAIKPKNRPANEDTTQLMIAAFTDQHLSDMLPTMLAVNGNLDSLKNVLVPHDGRYVFDITTFVAEATEHDVTELRNSYRNIINFYTKTLFETIAGNGLVADRMVIATNEMGTVAASYALIARKLAKHEWSFNKQAFATLSHDMATDNFTYIE